MQLRSQLQSTKKGAVSISTYFAKMKAITDGMAMAGFLVNKNDFIMHLLRGIPFEYNPVIDFINSTPTSMEIEDVLVLLLSQEMRI